VKQPLHLCFVAPAIWPILSGDTTIEFAGGSEVHQAFLARALLQSGFRVSVITDVRCEPEEFEHDGFRIVRIIRKGKVIPVIRNIHPRLTNIWDAMWRSKADIYFQSNTGAVTLACALFSAVYRRRFVYLGASDIDFDRDQLWKACPGRGGWRERQMYQLGLRLADRIVAQHMGQVAACRRSFGREPVPIANPYVAPPGATRAKDGKVLWVATVKSLKRPDLILELARSLPELQFRIVGGPAPGDEAAVFERTKLAASALRNVEFVGFVPFAEIDAHFDAARVFVNTSDYEGFPSTFLQSWARGIPTVSFFDCGAKAIDGQPVGLVCEDFDAMKRAVLHLATDDEDWAQQGRRAREYCDQNHSFPPVASKYSGLINELAPNGEFDRCP
jgi:glycosyltransferase involved in cell wall biosynthesis